MQLSTYQTGHIHRVKTIAEWAGLHATHVKTVAVGYRFLLLLGKIKFVDGWMYSPTLSLRPVRRRTLVLSS